MSYSYTDFAKRFSRLGIIKHTLYHKLAGDKQLYKTQMLVIDYIIKNPNCTQIELANQLMVSPASMALTIKRMAKAGLVTKKPDADNLRCNRIAATPLAKECFDYNVKICDRVDSIIFGGLSDSAVRDFVEIIDKITENALENSKEVLTEKEINKVSLFIEAGENSGKGETK